MSQNQEIIEAKLCAYIDNELDPDGRSEIEKHLEANPQHRRLLESLRATRDLIRGLPREQAPPEIAETLNGQLERSVLLDYTGDSLRPRSWPRVFAAAAIIVLTAGLGAAVYYALPKAQKPVELAAGHGTPAGEPDLPRLPAAEPTPAAPATTEPDRVADMKPSADRESDRTVAMSKTGSPLARKDFGQEKGLAEKAKGDAGVKDEDNSGAETLDRLARQVAENPDMFAAANVNTASRAGAAQQQAPGNALVMLVRSDAPDETEKELTTYFASQQIQWRQSQLPGEPANAVQQQALPSVAPNGTSWGTSQPMAAAKNSQVREQQVETGNSQRPQTERRNEAGSLDKSAGSENAIGGQDQAAITQKRAFPQSVQQESIAGKAAGGASQNAVGNQSLGNEGLAGNAYGRASGVYVCQMSRRQAEVLSNSISRDELKLQAGTTATLNSNTFNLATTAPAPQSNGLADAAQHQSANNVYGYRARAMLRDATPAGGELQMKQSAGARAGAPLTLTTTQPATAEGLRKSGAGAFYIEQPIGLAGVASGPTTQPASSTQPAEAQVGQAAPTTQPAEEPVNVVILVEATPPAAAGSPANAPPSAPAAAVPATSQPADSAK